MRHGRAKAVSAAVSGLSPAKTSPFPQLCNVLLVASLSKTLSQSGTWNLDANSIPISEPVVLEILRRNSFDPSKKLDFFRWCFSLRPGYKHSTSAYSKIFRTVCRTGLLGEIPDLLGSMKDDGVNLGNTPNPLFRLARGLRVEGKPDSFDVDMMNTFLSIYLSKGDLSLACKLFEIFNGMGVTDLTSYTYNSMMSSFVKKGHFKTACGVLDQMDENFTATDRATYNVTIQGLGKMGRADLASAVLERLTKQGGYLDIVMYNTLINTLGKANRLDEATRLFEHMKSNGINPDVVSYNTMIEVNSKAGKLKEAYKYLKVMLNAGCLPNHVTDTILDYLGKEMEKSRFRKHLL